MEIVKVRPRKRALSYDVFDRRYAPIASGLEDSVLRNWDDPLVQNVKEQHVWTVVDCDGVLYIVPGFTSVNYFARIVTERGWSDTEFSNPGYRYD